MRQKVQSSSTCVFIAAGMFLMAAASQAAPACVNPGGTAGCFSSISAAVSATGAGGVIQVAPGIYKENVEITKTLSLIGAGGRSIIDATGLSTGIFINGMSAAPGAGIGGVVISGMTVRGANYEGILVANATGVTIAGNTLYGNNVGLKFADQTCPGQPAFETNEGFDCGEAIHLTGVDHSVVSGNDIENNAGGILIADETGPTYQNLITGNVVRDNAYDCGITIASHTRAPNLPKGLSYGIYQNTISRNQVIHNGSIGQGAGVGIFAPGPGSSAFANVVSNNVLTDNGIGGVSMHNHAAAGVAGVPAAAPPVNLNDNVIVGNRISGNGADNDDPMSPGPVGVGIFSIAPVYGTVISQNDFGFEAADIAFNAPAGTVQAHLNSFSSTGIGVSNEGSGFVDANVNWWGCPDGPGGPGCATSTATNVFFNVWLPAPPGGLRPGRP